MTRQGLETQINRLAGLIDLAGDDVVDFAPGVDGGYPYIEIGADGQLHWIVKERGKVLTQRTTRDPDELLFWCFQSKTFSLASSWEARHREQNQDVRVVLWARQLELLQRLNPLWAQRWRRELAARQPADVALMP